MKIRLHRRRKWRNKLGRVTIKPSPYANKLEEFFALYDAWQADVAKRAGIPREMLYGTDGKEIGYV